jgi:hypothetical protein
MKFPANVAFGAEERCAADETSASDEAANNASVVATETTIRPAGTMPKELGISASTFRSVSKQRGEVMPQTHSWEPMRPKGPGACFADAGFQVRLLAAPACPFPAVLCCADL